MRAAFSVASRCWLLKLAGTVITAPGGDKPCLSTVPGSNHMDQIHSQRKSELHRVELALSRSSIASQPEILVFSFRSAFVTSRDSTAALMASGRSSDLRPAGLTAETIATVLLQARPSGMLLYPMSSCSSVSCVQVQCITARLQTGGAIDQGSQ